MMTPGLPWQILHGDVRRVCKSLPDNYFDAFLCDPPYGLSFMGRRWDYSVPSAMVWSEIERVVKPGAHGMIFGGPRTFHRVAITVEDGGLIPRDLLMWMFGSGFPKSADTSKAIDKEAGAKRKVIGRRTDGVGNTSSNMHKQEGFAKSRSAVFDVTAPATAEAEAWEGYGTALKPGYEPVILVRKMLEGTVAENALKWGVGALAIDETRVGEWGFPKGEHRKGESVTAYGNGLNGGAAVPTPGGRWPANVILDEEAAAMLDAQTGTLHSHGGPVRKHHATIGYNSGGEGSEREMYAVSGGASRFFYTAKADRYQREAGLDVIAAKKRPQKYGSIQDGRTKDGGEYERTEVRNVHPTVKPIDLIRYLATLILPPKQEGKPRRILVPFSGVSSEMIGCMQAGWDEVVGIEREAEYIEIAKARITRGGVFSGLMDRKMRRRRVT